MILYQKLFGRILLKPLDDEGSAGGAGGGDRGDSYTPETPVKTDFGYHVILLDDSRPLSAPSFEEVKPRLQQQAQQQQIGKLVDSLRAKAKVSD